MPKTDTYNRQESVQNEIKFWRLFFIILSLIFAGLLIWQNWSTSQLHRDYQSKLMDSVTTSILDDYQDYLNGLRVKIDLFQETNEQLLHELEQLAQDATTDMYMPLLKTLRADIQHSRLFALIDQQGVGSLSHITGDFLPACKEEIQLTVEAGEQNQLFLHRSSKSVHFDLLQPREKGNLEKGYLFVAFNTDILLNLLNKYQLPMQQLYLLRTDQKGLIEITTDKSKVNFPKDDSIGNELDSFSFIKNIPETRWSIAIRLEPDAEYQILNHSMRQSFLIWLLLSLSLLLMYRVKSRKIESLNHAQRELAETRQRATKILESITDAVIAVDHNNKITFINQQAMNMFGLNRSSSIGQPFEQALKVSSPHQDVDFSQPIALIANHHKMQFAGANVSTEKVSEVPVNIQLVPLRNSDGSIFGASWSFEDISITMSLSQQIVFQQQHDRLTGLFSRAAFESHLQKLLDKEHKEHANALLKVDIDKFDLINSSSGSFFGDDCLKQIGLRLQETLSEKDMLCRLGGDEFAIVKESTTLQQIEQLAENIRHSIASLTIYQNQNKVTMTACVGIVMLDEEQQDAQYALSAVSQAIRLAKEKGGNRCQLYNTDDPALQAHAHDIKMVSYLKTAIEDNKFVLFRQKIAANIDEQQKHKYEVLLRLIDADNKVVAPFFFIPAAEKYDLMPVIDRWVIQHSFIALSTQDDDDIEYSINLSGQTFADKTFGVFVESMFKQYRIAPKRICFEITETSAISNINNALSFMDNMNKLGVSFSLDDFGSGLSSFGYLKQLPIKYLKIDGSFIKDIAADKIDFAFVEAIQKISSEMGKSTVGEFVENAEIQELLKTIGVDYAQGYHIHKPELWYQTHPWVQS